MKKIVAIVISILMLLNLNCISAWAAEKYSVTAEDTTISRDSSQLVPVYLKGNKGIMGFKISIEFNPNNISIDSVSRGDLTAIGNFTTNFGSSDTKFDIVWNNTEEVTDDGTLFVLSVGCKKSDKIRITFSQQDTFNEKYEDVVLNCKAISVKYSEKKVSTTALPEKTTSGDIKPKDVVIDNSQILGAINAALKEYGIKNLKDVKDKKGFIKSVNKNLKDITGTDSYHIDDMNTLKSIYANAYQGEFVKEVSNNIDNKDIQNAIIDSLKVVGAESIESIPDNKKSQFVELVENKLKSKDSDVPNVLSDLSTEEALEAIKEINHPTEPSESEVKVNNPKVQKSNKTGLVVVSVVGAVTVILICFIIAVKRKKHNGDI